MPVAHAAAKPAVFGPTVLRELNRVRAQYHLPPVTSDRRMSSGAFQHSRDMAHRHYFAHGAWSGRVARAAGQAKSIGEVLGWLSPSSAEGEARWLVRNWLASPPHRVVLLNGTFRRVGIGRAAGQLGASSAAVYTVDFATPR
ncbi:MAG: SCP-like extracellular [Conexibacter sp.]|nr:SCP-like extracellular [Conexibacter sp.]